MDPKKAAGLSAAEIEFKLEIIKAKVWARASKAEDWADAGDLGHVLELVKEIESFLNP
jgi:hypothetical protein